MLGLASRTRQLGPYRLCNKLGTGSMGDVYRAHHVRLGRDCAVKLIRPERATDRATHARFEREVQAMASLSHWNAVQVYDYGEARDGTLYYAMELLTGMDLECLVRRHGPVPPERAIHLLTQVCSALREVHGRGMIHRDVKPANIFASARGGLHDVAMLFDFGIVRRAEDGEGLTGESRMLGTPLYCSPEQFRGSAPVDARADIYSLGCVAYFLLTGEAPLAAADLSALLLARDRRAPPPPSELRTGIPPDLDAVVLECLAMQPRSRFADAAALEAALAACRCAGQWSEAQAAAWWAACDLS